MDQYCDYHPDVSAKWICRHCQKHYCASCMPDADRRAQRGFCPHCGQPLQYRGAAGEVTPFWQRLPAFFRYPLARDPLLVLVLCTLTPFFLSANLIGLLVSLALVAVLIKYTYAVIVHTAEGNLSPPGLGTAFSGGGFELVFKQMAVFFLMGGLVWSAALVGGAFLAVAMFLFLLLALPASIIVLAMEHSVFAALNPLHLMALMARVGWPYLVLYGHLFLIMAALSVVQDLVLDQFGPQAGLPLVGLLNSYATLVIFHMLGYLLFQYQEELGFASETDPEPAPAERDRRQRRHADIDMYLKEGDYDRVQDLLLAELKDNPENPRRLEELYRLLRARGDLANLYKQRRRILPWLVRQGQADELAACLRDLMAYDEGFRLEDPALIHQCGQVLFHAGEYRLLLKLFRDFHKRFPDYEHLADAYLLVARTLANGLHRWDKAMEFLKFIARRCPGHPLAKNIPHYMDQARRRHPLSPPEPVTSS